MGLLTGSATGSGVICTLKFKAKAGGKSSVVFDFDELNNRLTRLKNADGNDIPFNKEEAAYYVFGSVKIKLQDTTTMADEGSTYQCIAICDNNLEMDVTGSTTFTASGGGSFTQNAFLAKYSGTYTIQGEYAGLIGTTTVVILPGTVCALIYVSGDNQAGSCALTLKEPFVVRAVDKYDNLCEGAGIIWEIFSSPSGAAGCLSSTKTTTNILGMASSTLTLGAEPPGTWTIRAVLPGQMDLPCTFTANSWRRFGNIAGFCLLDLGSGRLGTSSQIRVKIEQTGATATISEDSSFIFRDIPVGTYTLDFDSRGASSKVVSNVRISPAQFEPSTSIGNITLLSGDINNDGKINLEDWPRFVDAFFKQKGCTNWEEIKQADFNQDNKVNDEDFIVLRDNFGKLTEDMVMNAPSLAKAADMGAGSVELSLNLDTLDGLRVGNIIYLKVYIRNATNLLGAEVHLSFDPKVLEVVNVPAGIMQSQGMNARGFSVSDNLIQQGDYFAGDVWELMNKVDNISGKIDYSVGVLKAQKARDEGILAIVPFRIKSSGASSDIGFDFKEQENRQTLFVKRRYIGVEEEAIDTIPHVRSEGMIINIPYVNPDDIRVYPNPVDAGKCTEATFDYLPAGRQVTLKIYNVAGELVFEKSGMNIIRWGLRNGDGDTIASGVYFYYLRDESGVIKQGKIGVMR
ncbi:MAG: cohesin domain-containing protein [bacterium]